MDNTDRNIELKDNKGITRLIPESEIIRVLSDQFKVLFFIADKDTPCTITLGKTKE